ncbi:hypothetical protein LN996_00650 [Arthrobacter sp. AK01]|uniref:hypothetical protein n=1 Tax=Micrococcaceae TaxID=1268 RepID=UPI001E64DD3F|nr:MULTISPECIES: hypothetical protein [Micrococcaceae]MCD4849310.1 hypothetical protein [Arthrobacter sp. AK01]MCP1414684.1 hypothetical protein [Paenarthrobacter sp. A20]
MKQIARLLSTSSIMILGCGSWLMTINMRGMPRREDRDRGDVPGWVMITLMSAVLVAGLLALATPALRGMFEQAMSKVGK